MGTPAYTDGYRNGQRAIENELVLVARGKKDLAAARGRIAQLVDNTQASKATDQSGRDWDQGALAAYRAFLAQANG